MAGRAPISASFGPREQRAHRGRGDGLGRGDLAQHRDEAGVVGEAAEEEVGADDRGVAGRAGGSGLRAPRWAWRSAPRTGPTTGWPPDRRTPWARGRLGAGRREVRSGVASSAATLDRRAAGGRAAWPACRGRPTRRRRHRRGWREGEDGERRWADGSRSASVVRVPMRRQHRSRSCRAPSPPGNHPVTGRRERERSRPPPGRGPRPQRAAEQGGVLGGDREAQAGAAAASRRVRLVEPVEQVRQGLARHARTAIRDDDHGALGRPRSARPRPALRARGRARCRGGCRGSGRADAGRTRRPRRRRAARSPRPGGGPRRSPVTSRPRSSGSSAGLLGVGVEPRDLHQVVDQRPQPAHVGDQELGGAPRVGRHPVGSRLDQRRLCHERGERRPQLVRHVGDEPAVLLLRRLEPPDRPLQRVGHPVELRAQRPNSSRRPRGRGRSGRRRRSGARPAPPASTGRRMPRAMNPAVISATSTAPSPAATRPRRSWARAASTSVAGNTKYMSGDAACAPPTTSTGSPASVCQAKASCPSPTSSRRSGESWSSAPSRPAGVYGLPSPKSAIVSTSPRSLNASGRPLAANDPRVGRRRIRRRAGAPTG